ncbi:DNA-processing protein DprA [Isoptericola chiayiensis]|uniref:DNA-processing protein DprA n=1 Tax=Isoptericola chiayiensis TaxID=579446 RepID=A0ABP8YPE4_9MICO|nr:DNA processing protein [Isoptericola chiayiensis]
MDEPLFELPTGRRAAVDFDVTDPVLAAAAWSRLAEPGDVVAGALVQHLGATEALTWLLEAVADPARALRSGPAELVPRRGTTVACGTAGGPADPVDRDGGTGALRRLRDAVGRWAPRLETLDPRRELRVLHRRGGVLLTPADPGWPSRLADLGAAAPFALWVRGRPDVASWSSRAVSVVGARAATAYGERVTEDLAAGLADVGFTVVSGGAYGIDAAAHRGALASGGTTAAVLAGGVDRYYPQGNDGLLRRTVEAGGAVVAEVPPGSAPFRQRFLARNRVIAALTAATVVVEAAQRSGALSTARRASELLRPVGAVPGPVTSMTSAGCHALVRDGVAVCVTGVDDVVELAGAAGEGVTDAGADDRTGPGRSEPGPQERQVLDALPVRSATTVDSLARTAGLPPRRVVAALGALERSGMAAREGGRWRRRAR